jgi:hypothetical protein
MFELDVERPDGWRRCPVCAGWIEAVDIIMVLTAEHVAGRDRMPDAIPDGAEYDFFIAPCGHQATLLQLREAGVEIERFEHAPPTRPDGGPGASS